MTALADRSFALTAPERAALDRDGFLVRERVFDAGEVAAIAAACEALVEKITALAHGRKHRVGSYMFEQQRELELYAKWEPDAPEVLQGVEPFAHVSPALTEWGRDPRFLDPCRTICGAEEIAPFTEKLNLKRARDGGQYILHQDYPYWRADTPHAARVATAMLFLDEATLENGCLEAAPGSHKEGVQAMRAVEGFGSLEMDESAYDLSRLAPIAAPAGSVIFFGAMLVHRSRPNRSDKDRRALLYSYQPAGQPHMVEAMRRQLAEQRAAKAARGA